MIRCDEAVRVANRGLDEPLSLSQRLGLAIHRLICGPCRLYRKQLEAMRGVAQKLAEPQASGAALDDGARERLRQRLRSHKG